MRLAQLRSYVETQLWVLPAFIVVASAGAAFGILSVDERVDLAIVYSGGPESARQILATISGAMITFTGLVFSITILVLQLASSQFSPRVLRSFFRDRSSKIALGVFTGTFVFALIVLREIPSGRGDVPGVAVTSAVVFVVVAIGFFVHYLNHIARAIQVTSITRSVADETRRAIDDRYPQDRPDMSGVPVDRSPVAQRVGAPHAGSLVRVDERALIALASEADAVVELVPATGDFVPEGHPLLVVFGAPIERLSSNASVRSLVELGNERSTEQDPAYGLRQLVDIAERALSPGVNDPTTAVQVVDHIHNLLRRLVSRPFPLGERRDDDGEVRLIVHEVPWDIYVELGVTEIRVSGMKSLQVHRRLRGMLDDLLRIAPPERRPALRRQLRMLDAGAERFLDDGDRDRARAPDLQGIGTAGNSRLRDDDGTPSRDRRIRLRGPSRNPSD